MTVATKPRPMMGPDSAPLWASIEGRRLELPFCSGCGKAHLPAGPICPFCLSRGLAWRPASGRGRVSSWTRVHRAFLPSFAADIPYLVVQVELEEGPRIITNLVGTPRDATPRIGMAVKAVYEVCEGRTLLQFQPAEQV
jgi:uncharacterized OB-fold protein